MFTHVRPLDGFHTQEVAYWVCTHLRYFIIFPEGSDEHCADESPAKCCCCCWSRDMTLCRLRRADGEEWKIEYI